MKNNNNKFMVDVTLNLTSKEVPWLSFYYFNPIFNINEDILLPYYVTDYDYPDIFEWSSSDETVAIVKETGYVLKVAPGTCTIRCTHKETGVYAECSVTST